LVCCQKLSLLLYWVLSSADQCCQWLPCFGRRDFKTLRSWHANQWEIFYHARLPNALPYLFAAFKVSTPLALIGAVVAEWTGASGGLGRIMWLAYSNLNLPYLFAGHLHSCFYGHFHLPSLNWLEKKVVFWMNEN
jgi:ABC-type nitrate/sulfonate/bicarbonate transport system permease component